MSYKTKYDKLKSKFNKWVDLCDELKEENSILKEELRSSKEIQDSMKIENKQLKSEIENLLRKTDKITSLKQDKKLLTEKTIKLNIEEERYKDLKERFKELLEENKDLRYNFKRA